MNSGINRSEFEALAARVELLTAGGRDLAVVGVQVAEIIKDVAELRLELKDHRNEHALSEQSRQAGRRWITGISVTALGSLGGLYALVIALLQRH